MDYFVINASEGTTYIEKIEKQELLERLNENYYGSEALPFMTSETDTNYWPEGFIIIKGEVICPTAVEVVTKFELK